MGRAYFTVTAKCLIEALHLPPETKIVDMRSLLFERQSSDNGPDLQVIVESSDLDEVREGAPLPRVTPYISTTYVHPVHKFDGWH